LAALVFAKALGAKGKQAAREANAKRCLGKKIGRQKRILRQQQSHHAEETKQAHG
jgi:hypothetical protein